ncbi:hypothetical protein WP50_06165 [Lactiplantibacillus plantarum]|nr:hypothetical protein WP50_06165 [Lactiplantibacillus plantarum]
MKTIAINQYGSADEFTMVDMPTTEPQADEVQVAIHAFSLNPMDIAGNFIGGRLFDHWRPYYTALLGGGISTAILTTLIFWHSLWPYAIGLIIVGFGDGISMTVVNAYAATVTTTTALRL